MSVIRSAALRGFRATVAEFGGDADELARRVGLPVEALDRDDLLVDDVAVGAVLEIAAEQLDRPDLGLVMSRRQDVTMLGPLALAIQNSQTLGDALQCTTRYLFVHSRRLDIAMVPDPYGQRGVIGIRYGSIDATELPPQAVDLGLGLLHRNTMFLVGGPYGLRTVELPARPAAMQPVYDEFFGVPVRTGRPEAMLRGPRTMLDHPLGNVNDELRRLAIDYLDRLGAERDPAAAGVTARVRMAVRESLGLSTPDIESVGRLLHLHPRTLQRRLAHEGTSFAELVDEVRRDEARRYLTTTDMPLSQVAGLLALSEQSALTRCCRRWWDATPTAVRRGVVVPSLLPGT
ncbi:MAG: AraC family transcriptional regulator ligand-binding domain-containing protein [Jatrophihabitans sp.]|uniref:AraC family transcriptional regulator n=1 Tax=Jatrophihabitans sp. TaxID=1932789 RepID=UPI003F7DA896